MVKDNVRYPKGTGLSLLYPHQIFVLWQDTSSIPLLKLYCGKRIFSSTKCETLLLNEGNHQLLHTNTVLH